MKSDNGDVFESISADIYSSLKYWYTHSWGCRGLNNEEIEGEFEDLIEDSRNTECTCDYCNVDLVNGHIGILVSRERLTQSEITRKRFSLSIVIKCLSHFAESSNYCPSCGVDHALEDLLESYYWMGVLFGAERERVDYGRGVAAKSASDARHSYNRDRKQRVQSWYRKNKDQFSSKDEAAIEGEHLFNISFGTVRKHLRNV